MNETGIVSVIGFYVILRQFGNVFKGLCPFHDDKKLTFEVDPQKNRFRCWACGKHGDAADFVQAIEEY